MLAEAHRGSSWNSCWPLIVGLRCSSMTVLAAWLDPARLSLGNELPGHHLEKRLEVHEVRSQVFQSDSTSLRRVQFAAVAAEELHLSAAVDLHTVLFLLQPLRFVLASH